MNLLQYKVIYFKRILIFIIVISEKLKKNLKNCLKNFIFYSISNHYNIKHIVFAENIIFYPFNMYILYF